MMDRNEMPLTEMRILIVDDDATMRLQLGRMILAIGDGFRLAGEARDGRSALEFCRTNPVDIVITDMKMPGMDGNALIQALQHLKEPPAIIALSAYEDFPLVRTALRSGAADYMLKLSLTSQDLLKVLEEIRQSRLDFDRAASHPEKRDELEQVLYELAHFRSGDREEMRRRLAEAGFSFHAGTWYGLFLRIHETYRLEEIEQEEYAMLQFSLLSLIREELGKSEESYVFPGRTGEFYGFLRTGRREDLEIISRRLISTILLYHDLHATAGLSEGAGEVDALADLAEQARSAIRERFYCTGSVFWYQDTVRKLPDRRETAGEFRAEM